MSTVLEGSTKAPMVAMKFLDFVRQHPIHGPGTSAPAFENCNTVCPVFALLCPVCVQGCYYAALSSYTYVLHVLHGI
jgi:hypothetical protein